jgi:hypothetical protein
MSQYIDQAIDSLVPHGALKPMPGSDTPGVQYFHPTAPAPGAAPMIRFYRATDALKKHGMEPMLQNFFEWQKRFFSLGLKIYFPREIFMPWMRETLPAVVGQPLSSEYRGILQGHVAKLNNLLENGPHSPTGETRASPMAETPSHGVVKEGRKELGRAIEIMRAHPELLMTMGIFQGLHLQFLDGMMDKISQRKFEAPIEATLAEGAYRMAVNFDNAAFYRPAVWTALAYDKRVKGDLSQPLTAEDFAAGWGKMHQGGFSSEMVRGGATLKMECPFESSGSITASKPMGWGGAAAEGCAHEAKHMNDAYGLWCIHRVITHMGAKPANPLAEDLQMIRQGLGVGAGVKASPYAANSGHETFRQKIAAIHTRLETTRALPVAAL